MLQLKFSIVRKKRNRRSDNSRVHRKYRDHIRLSMCSPVVWESDYE